MIFTLGERLRWRRRGHSLLKREGAYSSLFLTLSGNEITDEVRTAGLFGDGRPAEGSIGIWENTTNLCTNGGFETDTTGWTIQFSAAITRDTSTFKFGSACGKITCTGVQFGLARFSTGTLVNATTYTFSAWVFRTETTDDWRLDFAAGGGLSGQVVIPPSLGWQRVSLTSTSTSTVATFCRVANYSAGASSTIYIDGVQLEQQPLATPYVETDGGAVGRSAAFVTFPTSVLDVPVLWIALRIRVGFSNMAEPGGGSGFMRLLEQGASGAANSFSMAYRESDNRLYWTMRDDSNVAGEGNTAWVVTEGDYATLIFKSEATRASASLNGAAFVASSVNSGMSGFNGATVELGRGSSGVAYSDSTFFWVACGTGTLSDADAAAIHAWGNTDPTPALFPYTADLSMIWRGIDSLAVTY